MSLISVRPFFRSRLKLLGYREHNEAFETDISSVQDKVFMLEAPLVQGRQISHGTQDAQMDVVVRAFFSAGRDTVAGIDRAISECERMIKDISKPLNRAHAPGVKVVRFESLRVEPFDASNDNVTECAVTFTALVYLDL